jgi:hypothetical protein
MDERVVWTALPRPHTRQVDSPYEYGAWHVGHTSTSTEVCILQS